MKTEKIVTLFIALTVIGYVLYFAGKSVAKALEANLISAHAEQSEAILDNYVAIVKDETDANKLTEEGVKLIKGNQTPLGIVNLKRAVEIDSKIRDAWVWLGYAQLKEKDAAEALESLKKAEEIDPINPYTYELQASAYEALGDKEAADRATDKEKSLKK